MTDCKLKESVIREITLSGKTYLSKDDIIDLIHNASKSAQSLSSQNDLQNLAKALRYGKNE
ncbi:MAG: hypothetical protein ACTSX1_09170 [Candidatus Heimdallarchaeaceae archaeon]